MKELTYHEWPRLPSASRAGEGQIDTVLTTFALNTFLARPGILHAVAVLGFNFLGDMLRERFDPRTRLKLGLLICVVILKT